MANYNTPTKPFQKGNSGRPKGALCQKSIVANKLGLQWCDLAPYMEGAGLERYLNELQSLNGRDFVTAYAMMLEYVKPKLGRTEVVIATENKIVQIFGKLIDQPDDDIQDIEHETIPE